MQSGFLNRTTQNPVDSQQNTTYPTICVQLGTAATSAHLSQALPSASYPTLPQPALQTPFVSDQTLLEIKKALAQVAAENLPLATKLEMIPSMVLSQVTLAMQPENGTAQTENEEMLEALNILLDSPSAEPFIAAMAKNSTPYFQVIWQVLSKHYSLFFPNQENNASAWEELSQKVLAHLNSQTSNTTTITLSSRSYTALESVLKDLPLPEGLVVNTVLNEVPQPSLQMRTPKGTKYSEAERNQITALHAEFTALGLLPQPQTK